MNNTLNLDAALRLPAPDITALIEGRSIVAMPRIFVNPERCFALYPGDFINDVLPLEKYYHTDFLPLAEQSLAQLAPETVNIKAWAKCTRCQVIDEAEALEILPQLTVWTQEAIEKTLIQRGHIFLAYLQVYLLRTPLEISASNNKRFIPLPQDIKVASTNSIISDHWFIQRSQQIEKRQPPLHPGLEKLQIAVTFLKDRTLAARELDAKIRSFLGWSQDTFSPRFSPDLIWIEKIAQVGNSSDGNEFEKLVRKTLIKLGFSNKNTNPKASLDPEATGGAGGIDVYCESPYPLVGECKASKKENVPNKVTAQLIHLGVTHLGQEQFNRSLKLIFAAGSLTSHANQAAIEYHMNVLRPETVQRLAQLQAKYQNSVNLWELKKCLENLPFGEEANQKVNQYIDRVRQDIKLRSQLVESLKSLGEPGSKHISIEVKTHYNVIFAQDKNCQLDNRTVHELLVELSSPLTGYLGRDKSQTWEQDNFYFLHDLLYEEE